MTFPPSPSTRVYAGAQLDRISYPIGGLGAGMFCLDGTGSFSHFCVRHLPDYYADLKMFSALAVTGHGAVTARLLEGPISTWKPFFPYDRGMRSSGHGAGGLGFGLPRFSEARFAAQFPFASIELKDESIPLDVQLVGWSPFVPSDADASSLPVGAVEYQFTNSSSESVDCIYSFHLENWLRRKPSSSTKYVRAIPGGFVMGEEGTPEEPAQEAACAAWLTDTETSLDLAWFRGGWFDEQTVLWRNISEGRVISQAARDDGASPGGSLYLPLRLAPREQRTVRLHVAWFAPYSTVREGHLPLADGAKLDPKSDFYRPWYASRFASIPELIRYWTDEQSKLRQATANFTRAFHDTTLPPEILEAVEANLSILKSPTVLREAGGKVWAWEGTGDDAGSCPGTCTHVWNYAQALPHLFPALERGLREVEFLLSQDARGHQNFRAALPLGPTTHHFHSAADGQLGGIIKAYRDWRICGDTPWLQKLWPLIEQSLDFCIATWDPDHCGAVIEPHHNTYDIEFWGADGMCTSIYLSALRAAAAMGTAVGTDVSSYQKLADMACLRLDGELFNGEYFIQKIQWKGLHSADPVEASKLGFNLDYSPEARALLEQEGPKYQYGTGCLSDGIIGEWMAWAAGLDPGIDPAKIESHLTAVHRYNYRKDLSKHANPQRPAYAFNREGGLLLCSWPRGGALTLPFVYSEEVWTGIEYQVAAHLISMGRLTEGLEIVRACRARYNGHTRNPFDEIECGHWYARALSSYSLLQAVTGARYDALEKKLYLAPQIEGNFRAFFAFDGGYGTVGLKDGKAFFEVLSGRVEVREIVLTPFLG